jgi:pimeloyl-ACP methyl ester carboxylesterase
MLDPTPDDDEELEEVRRAIDELVAECTARAGRQLPLVGTVNAARDLDRIRAALAEERLTYLGYSYGTVLGATFAALYPANVRALVLDGGVDTSLGWVDFGRDQAASVDAALQRFFDDCRNAQCPIAEDPEAAWDEVRSLLEQRLERGERDPGPEHLLNATLGALWTGPALWPDLAAALDDARRGELDPLARLGAPYVQGRLSFGASIAISCADERERPELEEIVAVGRSLEQEFPRLGEHFAGGCPTGWPVAAEPLPRPTAPGAPPILVIGTQFDPATPHKWSAALAQQLGSGVLLTYEGDGHTASEQGHRCIDDAVLAYLVDLEVPPPESACSAEQP